MTNYLMQRVELYKKLETGNWDSNAIVLTDANKVEVMQGLGQTKDTFRFEILNSNNKLFETFYSGTDSATNFTLDWTPPTTYINDSLNSIRVFILSGTTLIEQGYSTDYTISGNTLTFVSAPALGYS